MVLEPARLSHHVRIELERPGNELWLSPISAWEALLLNAKRKIELPKDPAVWIAEAAAQMREVALTLEIVLAAQHLQWPHRDPADRFLAATAQVLDLTLVTADRQLLGLREIKTLANR